MKKAKIYIFSSLLIASLLAGCTNGTNGTNGANPVTSGTTGTRENIVRISADSTPILDPAAHAGNSSSIAFSNIYDTLVFPKGDDIVPDLAESWEPSADGKTYTFKLKKGVKFHDGSELTASDVVFTTNRIIAIGQGFAYLYSSIIEDVEAPDDYTVVFKLKNSYGPFPATLCRLYIVNEEQIMANIDKAGPYGEFGDYGNKWMLFNDAGSGPYKVTELVQNDYMLATKFNDWHMGWEGKDKSPEKFKIIYGTEPSTIRTMMQTQSLEISDMWQSPESLKALDNLEGVSLASYSTRLVQNVFFNTSIAPTDDVNFRRALSCLIDYNTLIDIAFTGSKKPAGPVSTFTAGHVDTTQFNFDIEKAKEYLAKSKYADTYKDYPIEFLHTDNGALEKVGLAFQAAASQIGIKVEITKAPWTTVQERVSTAESTPHTSTINSGPQFNEAGATLESQFHSKTQGTYENVSWISTPEIDAQIEEAMATIDKTERFAKYEQLQKYIVDELCPTAWIADLVEKVAYQETYLKFPASEASAKGDTLAYLMGYPFFMPDIEISLTK